MKLSICMATFNRGAFIGRTLESIVGQASEEVEIVIVDGGSSDNTGEVVLEYGKRFPGIRYFRQEKNMGVDRDFNTAVEWSRGDYCWLMSDDDVLKPGAIRNVLDAIGRGHGLIVVNAEVRDAALEKVLDAKRLRIDADRVYRVDETARFFEDVATYLSFIGCVVMKSRLWKSRVKEPYFGSLFVHVGVIFQSPPRRTPGHRRALGRRPVRQRLLGRPKLRDLDVQVAGAHMVLQGLPESVETAVVPRDPWREAKGLADPQGHGGLFAADEYRKWIAPLPPAPFRKAFGVGDRSRSGASW